MKYFALIGLALCFASCKKDSFSNQSEFNASLQKWNTYKASVKNSYSYIAYSGSVFGYASQTAITVINGTVVQRFYTLTRAKTSATDTVTVMESWSENPQTLNSHQDGAATLTIDQIYEKAQKEWLTADKKQNEITFETDDKGIIAVCGYTPKDCVDDCFRGITIKNLGGVLAQ
ncbi:hypothetical protein C8P68_104293 [Mucilaginibacter yixingensis]|uniref:Lipocalin-like protein n=1 Tax=Mucilaginibacter yixingensis TaxID=1295612 RepID=A0A2T5J9U8_9SPHI|nr:hypothetical protein [Mucilaginibacter yixingensis]PTQ96804.1 hypothetical protein C8P68_104293 [Mucilaginibacter yixingensis]